MIRHPDSLRTWAKTGLLFWLFWSVAPMLANGQTDLTPADRKHGELVVRQIFIDRPDLGQVVGMDDPFATWMKEQFAGQAVGDRLCWDNSPPFQALINYSSPSQHSRGFIFVSDDPRIASLDRCSEFVFALCAVSRWQTRDRLSADALSGAVDRDQFISKWARMDFETKVATKKFLMRFGFAERASDKTPLTSVFLSQEEDYGALKIKWDADKRNPANPFVVAGQFYDALKAANPLSPGI